MDGAQNVVPGDRAPARPMSQRLWAFKLSSITAERSASSSASNWSIPSNRKRPRAGLAENCLKGAFTRWIRSWAAAFQNHPLQAPGRRGVIHELVIHGSANAVCESAFSIAYRYGREMSKNVSRRGLDRCRHRHGVGNLRDLKATAAKPKHSRCRSPDPKFPSSCSIF